MENVNFLDMFKGSVLSASSVQENQVAKRNQGRLGKEIAWLVYRIDKHTAARAPTHAYRFCFPSKLH
jgi:hypothetical protein